VVPGALLGQSMVLYLLAWSGAVLAVVVPGLLLSVLLLLVVALFLSAPPSINQALVSAVLGQGSTCVGIFYRLSSVRDPTMWSVHQELELWVLIHLLVSPYPWIGRLAPISGDLVRL